MKNFKILCNFIKTITGQTIIVIQPFIIIARLNRIIYANRDTLFKCFNCLFKTLNFFFIAIRQYLRQTKAGPSLK